MIPLVSRIERVHALLVFTAVAIAFVGDSVGATSVFLGGALMWGNVWLFKQLFAVMVQGHQARYRLAIGLLFAKLPLLGGLLWLVSRAAFISLDGAGLAAGITCFPVAVVMVSLTRRSVFKI